MTSGQRSKLEMFEAVQTYLDANSNKWEAINKIVQHKNELNELLLQVYEHKDAQEEAKVYVHQNKVLQKKIVAEKADILNDILEVHGEVSNNDELKSRADKSFTDLFRLPNTDFITVIHEIIDLLSLHLEALADYGVTDNQIQDFKNSFDAFLVFRGLPRQYRIKETRATKDLETIFKEATDLLNNKLDKVIKVLKRKEPSFYNGYNAARVIVDN
ncbi:hypothetical protein [Galbibacter mesophilus]|uniref:hypothetical protein n=1 Tax=Galbibacter mesophilus TaxID=379069 RepID=UPI00191FAB97|nr:hypothetical protein [Galbibacter mesophilus]MCM5662182.1 hypothetical protein [Galbibacter mesophilus]